MNSALQALLADIRADLGDDFIASDIVGMDGMSIAGHRANADFDSGVVAAHFTMVMKLAGKVSDKMQLGRIRENQVNTGSAMVFTRSLGNGSFFWLLATKPSATLPSSTRTQEWPARNNNANPSEPSNTIKMRGSPKYHQTNAGSIAQARMPTASPRPRRSSTRQLAAALNQNNSGNAAEPTTTRVACMRPRMMNSAKARMWFIPYYLSTICYQRPWLSV